MKVNLIKKLRSRAGETISETLLSVLVGALALVMLAGAVSAASGVITKSREKLNTYYNTTETVISKVYGKENLTAGTVTVKSGETKTAEVSVRYAVNDVFGSTPVVVYRAENE